MRNQANLKQKLQEFGLSKEESLVYLAGLGLGKTTILKLSKHTQIPRTTIYSIVHTLSQKGLFKINIVGFKKTYEAENPEKLLYTLETKVKNLKEVIPEFLSLYTFKNEGTDIRTYEGIESIKNLYMETLDDCKSREEYFVITDQEAWFNIAPEDFMKYKELRGKKNIKTRLLFQKSETAIKHKKFEKNFNEEIRFLPDNTNLHVDFICTPKRVVIFQTTVPYTAIEIRNPFVVELYKNLFEIIWRTL